MRTTVGEAALVERAVGRLFAAEAVLAPIVQAALVDAAVGPALARPHDEAVAVLGLEAHAVVDTTTLNVHQLKGIVQERYGRQAGFALTIMSFGFKHGIPLDADLVFDVRALPNPHYDPVLRPLTGRDAPVSAFLDATPAAQELLRDIESFVAKWLPSFARDNRHYLTVAIGCTGGQHRSVFIAERLANYFRAHGNVLVRHREMAAAG